MTGQAPHLARYPMVFAGACLAIAVGTAACNGDVGPGWKPGNETGTGSTPGGGTPGSGGAGANPGTGNTPGTGSTPGTGNSPGTGNTPGTGGSVGVGTGGGSGQPTPLVLDSGRTVIRRLNRTEYSLTVRDLLDLSATAGDRLPVDQISEGFDTVGEFLSVSPLFVETMEGIASGLINDLFALPATDAKRTKILSCTLTTGQEATCARKILTAFTRRAYRRPATTAEIDSLMALVDKVRMGATYNDGLKAALTAVLLSPHFLYKEETSVGVAAGGAAKPINSFELATRLSYFLWATMPDDALSASADSGKLASDATELAAQVERMIMHEKASALTTSFANRWLTIYRLDSLDHPPAPDIYKTYDDQLRIAAQQETTMFFSRMIAENLPLSTLIDADFTYANARLARHYGVSVTGDAFVKVSLAGTPRAGVLTQTSFLMSNSHPDRSGPVQRGDWILDRMLCAATPPPPADLGDIPSFPPASTNISGRKFLEQHRADPNCRTCHQFIDPLGLGLENFDGIGAYRTMDSGTAVDASGTYPGGIAFSTPAELVRLIAKDVRYPTCVTKQLLTYGVGRPFSTTAGLNYSRALAERAQQPNWRSWIAMVTASEAFRTNRPEAP